MNGFIRSFIIVSLLASFVGCASNQSQSDDLDGDSASADQPLDDGGAPAATASTDTGSASQPQDDFADFDNPSTGKNASAPAADAPAASAAAAAPSAPGNDADLAIEDEINSAGKNAPAQAAGVPPAPPMDQPAEPPIPEQTTEIAPPTPAPAPVADVAPVPDVAAPAQAAEAAPAVSSSSKPVEITDLKFQANDAGGTVIVEANGPISYTTRANPDLKQFIVEAQNVHLPSRLTRSLNTRDIKGAIGTVDAYQNPGSTTARFVVQLRDGVSTPAVQAEGNSLLIVSAPNGAPEDQMAVQAGTQSFSANAGDGAGAASSSDDRILSSLNLSDFLAGNTKFYGKKISIETNNMDIREALKLITEESGVNMVISDEVKGSLSLKLRQVPWDQALVMVMKVRKLGYTRQGNVLRIAPLADLRQEEEDATKLADSRLKIEPLKVRMFSVSYAKVDELEKKIKDFLSEKGKVVGDSRTNALVVTDRQETLDRVAKLIANLDVQPAQVLIEGKIVEAQSNFTRSLGVSWNSNGNPVKLGTGKNGPINMTPNFNVNSGNGTSTNFNFGLNVGTLDFLGNLSAALALSERDDEIKVISSPRILTLTNEAASISQTTEVPLKTITVQNNVTQTTYQFKPLTMKLDVTPQITSDGSVIMGVDVSRQFEGALVDAANDVFAINSREAKTKVLVHNGQTAVIGGIYQSDATDSDQGVPGLKDVPYIGRLFSTNNKQKTKIELVIFLTPRILGKTETTIGTGPSDSQDL